MKKTKRNVLPKLKKESKINTKYKYKIKETKKNRRKAIAEYVKTKSKIQGNPLRKTALKKKARFNILRIYRRYKKVDECNKITGDMKFMDTKYNLGYTKNICGDNKKN